MTEEIIWEEPPDDGRVRRARWNDRLTPLVAAPSKWARITELDNPQAARQLATNLRYRKLKTPPGRWEFQASTVDGRGYVYARYLGPTEEES